MESFLFIYLVVLVTSAVFVVESKQSISFSNGTANKTMEKLTVKVINMKTRQDRWTYIQNQWSSYFNLQRIHPLSHHSNIPVCSLAKTLLSLLSEFKHSNDDYIIVMEDDAYPVTNFNFTEFQLTLKSALETPLWHVMNLGPWFTKQPMVEAVNDRLVRINYFHTTHFMIYHRRAYLAYYEMYRTTYEKVDGIGCQPIDDFFGNYIQRSKIVSHSIIIAPRKGVFALQNLNGDSTIGSGPQMTECAMNAALSGKKVFIEIIESSDPARIPPTFKPPLYGYYKKKDDVKDSEEETDWYYSYLCNVEDDRYETLQTKIEEIKEQQKEHKEDSDVHKSSTSNSKNATKNSKKKKKKRKYKTSKARNENQEL
jgi:GR25 family glycosyltransferase involved in LPS biosynthesis